MEDAEGQTANKGGIIPKSRRQKTMRKLQKLRFRRALNQNRSRGTSNKSHDLSSLYDVKMAKLRSNNRSLAKALAAQKIETQQWYNEVISLKAELQDAHEQLLRYSDTDAEAFIVQEVEQRMREQSEPFNAAISESMQNVLVVVESLTKLKKLVASSMKNHRSSSASRKSSSAFSLPRTSGSRLPLAPTGSNSSPRQSVVRPMVGGLVLQPARVAIPKLDLTRRKRLQERREAQQDLDMSVIGEQSINQEEEESSSQNDSQTLSESDIDLSNRIEESVNSESENTSHANESINHEDSLVDYEATPVDEPQRTSRQKSTVNNSPVSPRGNGRLGRGRGRGRRTADMPEVPNSSPVTSIEKNTSGNEVQSKDASKREPDVPASNPGQEEEDPLEGPSWWYTDVGSSRRSRGRGRGKSRGRGRSRGSTKHSPGVNLALESSSESECDELPSNKSKVSPKTPTISHQATKKSTCASLEVSLTSPLTLEHSYLASPASMLARLEKLEAKAGRRSKARSRGTSLRASMDEVVRTSDAGTEGQRRLTRRRTEVARTSLETDSANCDNDSFSLKLDETVMDGDDDKVESQVNDSILMPPPSMPVPVQTKDFLINDNDLTCIGDMSMDMTEPISKIISQATAELNKTDEIKITEKRFFKSHSPDLPASSKAVGGTEATPFDLSLMDATVVNIPPYSSQRALEKENLPPTLDSENSEELLNLRRVSIVLEDVMKCPDFPEKYTPDLKLSLSAETVKSAEHSSGRNRNALPKVSKGESPLMKKPRKRKTLRFSVAHDVDDDDDVDEDEKFSPKKGRKSQRGRRKTTSVGISRGRKSTNAKKRSSVVDSIPPEPSRKQRKRRKDSDGNTPLTTPETSMVCELDEELKNEASKNSSEEEGMTKITLPVQGDIDANNKNVNLSGWYVMIHRTPEKVVQQSIIKSEEPVSTTEPLSSLAQSAERDSLSKQMEMVMKRAQQMKVDQDHIEEVENKRESVDCGQADENTLVEGFRQETSEEQGGLKEPIPDVRNESDTKGNEEEDDQIIECNEDENRLQQEVKQEVEEPRRRRGAAMKISSFKEPSLSMKMRRSETTAETKAKTKGRQPGRSSTS